MPRGGKRDGAGRTPKERPAPVADLPPIGPLIGERLRQAIGEREAASGETISLRDLAAVSSLSVPTLRQILAGRGDPKCSGLRALAGYLRVRAGWLLGE